MFNIKLKKLRYILASIVALAILQFFGVFIHLFEKDFKTEFNYPYNGEIEDLILALKQNATPTIPPINNYNFIYHSKCVEKCANVKNLRLVYLIKSSRDHYNRRRTIRSTWGYEHRFSDVEIRTVFLLGLPESPEIDRESSQFKDIVQANFTDSYYNNTYKTAMGLDWAARFCSNAKFYMFVDDDFYVSTKNVLRFVRYPTNYPQYLQQPSAHLFKGRKMQQLLDFELDDDVRLYAGFVFRSSPLRHYSSKWYVSLNEYPYDLWPPYATAGAYVLSKTALIDMHLATYYTKHFRFDDIYMGLLAFKTKIEPFHCKHFYYYKNYYNVFAYEFTIASHGYENPEELLKVWTEQKSVGNA